MNKKDSAFVQLVDKQVGAVKQSQLSLIIKEKKNPSLSGTLMHRLRIVKIQDIQ